MCFTIIIFFKDDAMNMWKIKRQKFEVVIFFIVSSSFNLNISNVLWLKPNYFPNTHDTMFKKKDDYLFYLFIVKMNSSAYNVVFFFKMWILPYVIEHHEFMLQNDKHCVYIHKYKDIIHWYV